MRPAPRPLSLAASRRGPGFPGRGGAPGPAGSPRMPFPLTRVSRGAMIRWGESASPIPMRPDPDALRGGVSFFLLPRPFREVPPRAAAQRPGRRLPRDREADMAKQVRHPPQPRGEARWMRGPERSGGTHSPPLRRTRGSRWGPLHAFLLPERLSPCRLLMPLALSGCLWLLAPGP